MKTLNYRQLLKIKGGANGNSPDLPVRAQGASQPDIKSVIRSTK
ncbi:hypothetical protein N483_00905 [Pseudoalteromonas luteoviolacea NCIMB 1944]|uniref:Uncharacterized protein n=1 Tax=Pseudoalteromonas luteoviolacea (strain 2ta16) TaxID=1353533 RepID=V4HPJ2_PSEL2|nr:hypothetical protein PL2TA16_03933 [Pseudoalteromonas luteoviolacea 2ta16]KZN35545.1 hypothetical protein N483_00905 [Pseudoalteromonas luteoviolacea NCIMB 1944]